MTANEIRATWSQADPDDNGAALRLLAELVAQFAEMNEHLGTIAMAITTEVNVNVRTVPS